MSIVEENTAVTADVDEDELRRRRARKFEKIGKWVLPVLVMEQQSESSWLG